MTGKATAPEALEAFRASQTVQEPIAEGEVVLMGRRATDTPPRIDVVEALAGAVNLAREAAESKDVGILYAYSADRVWVRAEESGLRNALDALLARAVAAIPVGSLAVRCMPQDGEALLEVVEVRDAEAVGADFEAIFAAPSRDGVRLDATGFGPMHELVRESRGSMGLSYSPSRGNHVTVRLPLAAA